MDNPQATHSRGARFWRGWLLVDAIMLLAFGLSMVIAPDFVREGFSVLLYGDAGHIGTFGEEAAAYIELLHAVLGAVMAGWSVLLLFILRGPFRRGSREGWRMIALSLSAWFVPDTTISLLGGFWQNAILNTIIIVLFAVPLAATRRHIHVTDGQDIPEAV